MASVLLYPIAYGLELFLASALSTQIAVSLAAVLVSTAAVIYCQRTVALWWSLTFTTTQTRTQTRTNIIRPHAVVDVTEERYEPETDPPRDRGGGQSAPRPNLPTSEETEKGTIKEELISAATTPISAVAATRRKLSDDSEGSTEGSLNGEEGTETRRRRKSSSGSSKEGQPEQSWLNRQPAYMHRSHWVAKPAQPRNNPLLYKPSLLRRASADNNGHHHHRVADFAATTDTPRKRVEEDDIQDGGEREREKPRKPTLDRRSSFPSSLPSSSATSLLQSPRMQASSSLVTTLLTSSSTSSPTSTPSCSVPTRQSSSSSDDHGSDTAEGNSKPVLSGGETESKGSPTIESTPQDSPAEKKRISGASRSLSSPLPSITVMAPATIHEETESAESSTVKIPILESSERVIPKLSLTTELSPVTTTDLDVRILESKDVDINAGGGKKQSPTIPKKRISLPIICVESESDKSDCESQANTTGEGSPPAKKSNDLFVKFSVRPAFERPPPKRRVSADSANAGPARPQGPMRKDSLGIPTVVKGEIAYPGAQRKMPTRRQSEPLTITVQPPVICETKQEKDQTISQEVIRPIPQRADSLGVPQVFTGEASFPLKQPQTGPPGDMSPGSPNPKKPPGARRKESLEVPTIATDEVSFPPVSKTVMGPPTERPIKRHRPLSLNIPSLSATTPEENPEDRPPFSAPGAKRKHTSILKRGNSQEKPGRKKSVTFSPTVSPQEMPPEFNFDRETDGAIYTVPKRPKMFRHYSIDSSETSLRQERYRAAGRQVAQSREAGILFSDDQPNISGIDRTSSDFSSLGDIDINMPPISISEGSKDVDMETHTSDMEENDDVFEDSKALEISNAKARFLAAGGARAVMSVLCTQDSSDSNGNGPKYSSVDLLEAEAKTVAPPSDDSSESGPETTTTEETKVKEPETTIKIVPETESTRTITTLSSPDKEIGPKRFISSEDLDIRASLLFVETVRSSVESDLSEGGRHSHSSEESENSASEDVGRYPVIDSNSAKSRFFQSCQEHDVAPRHQRYHGDDIWNTPTIPEVPEPLELDSQDEESTSAARDADIDDSSSSSPSYSSSWYGFLELDPSRPSLANLDVEIIESTDNDLSLPFRGDDDTGDEVEDDCGRREHRDVVGSTEGDYDGRPVPEGREGEGGGEGGMAIGRRSGERDEEVNEACPESAPVVAAGVPLTEAGAPPAEDPSSVGSSKDDVLRHQWPLAVSPASSPGQSRRRRQFNTPIILDNGSSVLRAGLADGVAPSVTIPTVVGRLKKDIESFRHRKDVFVGSELTKKYGLVCVNHPIKGGVIDNWAELEHIWDHVINRELNVTWEDHPILMTEVASAPKRQRERILEVLFETYKIPACFVVNQAALALHANGETSGLVLSSGSGVTEIVPVYQGCTMSHAVTTLPTAGRGVTRRLQRILMDERAFSVSTPFDHRILQEMKENMAYVCQDYESEMLQQDLTTPIKYSLPDGSSVSLRKKDLFHCTETMFKPDIVGLPQKGLIQVLADCLEKCDPVFLEGLDPALLLAGGNTKLRGFTERLQLELDKGNFGRTVIAHDNRDITTWIGGAILASHSSFGERWISSEDFDEFGTSLVHKQTI